MVQEGRRESNELNVNNLLAPKILEGPTSLDLCLYAFDYPIVFCR